MADTPAWFVESEYLTSKLNQLKELNNDQYGEWTEDDVAAAIEAAGMTPFQHFEGFSGNEGTSPNAYFNVAEYLANKTAQMNAAEEGGRSNWNATEVAAAIAAAGMTPWTHFQQFGWKEGVNPSASFDVEVYFQDKLAQLQEAGEDYENVDQVKAVFAEAGLDPIAHYYGWGEEEGLVPAKAGSDRTELAEALENLEAAHDALDDFLEANEFEDADELRDEAAEVAEELADARTEVVDGKPQTDAQLAINLAQAETDLANAQAAYDTAVAAIPAEQKALKDALVAAVKDLRAEQAKQEAKIAAVGQAEAAAYAQFEAFKTANPGKKFELVVDGDTPAENGLWDITGDEPVKLAEYTKDDSVADEAPVESVTVLPAGLDYAGINALAISVNKAFTAEKDRIDHKNGEGKYADEGGLADAVVAANEAAEAVDDAVDDADVSVAAALTALIDAEVALAGAEEALVERDALIQADADAQALVEELEALEEGLADAEAAIADLGYELVDAEGSQVGGEQAQLFVFVEEDAEIVYFGQEADDLLFFGTGYTYNPDADAGDNNVLEFFVVQDGDDVLVQFEQEPYGSASDAFDTITLIGTNVDDVVINDLGFISL